MVHATDVRSLPACKALICEDDVVSRKVIELFVKPYASCTTCESGLDAVSIFEMALTSSARFTLVLLDVGIPGMAGLEVLKRIRELEATHAVASPCAVVMLTGRSETTFMEEAKKFGCTRYILKPIAETQLIDELRDLGIISGEGSDE